MDGLSIKEVAEATGLTIYTLRYYEQEGLMINPVKRLPNGHRRYTDFDVGWLNFVSRLRETGMPIVDIRQYAEMERRGTATVADRLALLENHQAAVRKKIDTLTRDLQAIDAKIAHYKEFYEAELQQSGERGDPWCR